MEIEDDMTFYRPVPLSFYFENGRAKTARGFGNSGKNEKEMIQKIHRFNPNFDEKNMPWPIFDVYTPDTATSEHGPFIMFVEVQSLIWQHFESRMLDMMTHPFRHGRDATGQLFSIVVGGSDYYQVVSPNDRVMFFMMMNNEKELIGNLAKPAKSKGLVTCYNDDFGDRVDEKLAVMIKKEFLSWFPVPADFEIVAGDAPVAKEEKGTEEVPKAEVAPVAKI
jgi:hypothetical protein